MYRKKLKLFEICAYPRQQRRSKGKRDNVHNMCLPIIAKQMPAEHRFCFRIIMREEVETRVTKKHPVEEDDIEDY